MPELNLDKILASLDLRISEVTLPDEYDQISKDYLGKDSIRYIKKFEVDKTYRIN